MRQAVIAEPDLENLKSKWDVPAKVEDWPPPQPIHGELPPVETFSEDLLPTSF
jgi:hypothetical protein